MTQIHAGSGCPLRGGKGCPPGTFSGDAPCLLPSLASWHLPPVLLGEALTTRHGPLGGLPRVLPGREASPGTPGAHTRGMSHQVPGLTGRRGLCPLRQLLDVVSRWLLLEDQPAGGGAGHSGPVPPGLESPLGPAYR
ncbi:hypothetical protein NHX12_018234 [Muraenolepis orangiensis]|uniref:Uncharacterized protein n=1 Tax=Muraenolepis orangiensis TaxID=630683 RepID=A0A9Q0EXX8_9TELE|nr:hypothetical protein NHX12_018234 [Muraenolepis orangiensis]